MGMTDQTRINALLSTILANGASVVGQGTPVRIKLGTTAPTSTANMTELTGSGYQANGTPFPIAAITAGQTTGPQAAITWTNASGSAWSITGLEIWDSGGTLTRWFFGSWTGAPVSVANGNSFQVAAGAVTINASGW